MRHARDFSWRALAHATWVGAFGGTGFVIAVDHGAAWLAAALLSAALTRAMFPVFRRLEP